MQDIKIFKQKDLILKVNSSYDPTKLDLDSWELFLDILCSDRSYQKEAIKSAIIYLASERYNKIEDIIEENYKKNDELKLKYSTLEDYNKKLQLPNKLFANIDLATGTGKSYALYGVAQIMLGLGLVDKVLVLCPSLTIESGLTEKFENLSGNSELKNSIPENAMFKNPRIVNANVTIKSGDICIENIHAIYANTGSSIEDSLIWQGEQVLVLNDESHHIFNKIDGRNQEAKNLKKWKEFLLNTNYNFKYILGFTGTAYHDNEYFNDVIFRYSLREAIEDKIVKNIDYVQKDDSIDDKEKFQKIYQNHNDNKDRYPSIKPLSILITKDISNANNLKEDFLDFLEKQLMISREECDKKVLIVTSHKDHRANLPKLKYVDDKNDPIEWIISVSMLTEGWDVKNVFQIVPWEDRAFNSKLLISQVLGRGLRVPEHFNIQPKVIVFNHDSWSKNIKGLIDEVLEIETRLESNILKDEKEFERAKYNFDMFNLNYSKEEIEVEHKKNNQIFNFSRLEQEGINLESQTIKADKDTTFESVLGGDQRDKTYIIESETWEVNEIVDRIYDEFQIREWEGITLKLGEDLYTKNNLPPRDKIKAIIQTSMDKRGIKGNKVIEKNVHKILAAFSTLLRKKGKTVVPTTTVNELYLVSTRIINKESIGIGNLKRNSSIFFADNFEEEIFSRDQIEILNELLEDEDLPRKAIKMQNLFLFKTPFDLVFSNSEPERKFMELLCKKNNASLIDAWIKSRDIGFYSIEYSLKYGGKDSKTRRYTQKAFNPDFFIKVIRNDIEYIVVIEIKADADDSSENKAKNKYAKEHFEHLNNKLSENDIKQIYIFHFLSPNGYTEFFDYLKNGTLFESQEKFRCGLELLLEEDN